MDDALGHARRLCISHHQLAGAPADVHPDLPGQRQCGVVITSYSIHYTKLYEEIVPVENLFEATQKGTLTMLHAVAAMWGGIVPVGEVERNNFV